MCGKLSDLSLQVHNILHINWRDSIERPDFRQVMTELVGTIRWKLEGRVFDYRCGQWVLYWLIPTGYNIVLGSNQSLTAISTGSIFWWVKVAAAYGCHVCYSHMSIVEKFCDPQILGSLMVCTDRYKFVLFLLKMRNWTIKNRSWLWRVGIKFTLT